MLCAGTQGLGTTKNDTLQADISFQGYNNDPSDPNRDPTIKAKIQYRTYFANSNSSGVVNSPIIILDGFDPGDKRKIEDCDCENDADCLSVNLNSDGSFNGDDYRSIVDLQNYQDNLGFTQNVLNSLRERGFDVIIVNFPTYKTDDLNTPEVILDEVEIDGGAYYIESNAFALVKLLQETRDLLAANGSDKKIKLIGPSMGGQIAKYALSYMEKQEQDTGNSAVWDHNVSHYVSFDSPHLGANIPLGDQALLYLLSGESAAAKEFYEEELASPASRQQLIEFHQPKMVDVLGMQVPSNSQVQQSLLNARTISQGFSQNHGDDFFQIHYNNQFNNGVSGSNGFPLKTVNLAVVNGSLSGSTLTDYVEDERAYHFGNDSQRVFNATAHARVKIDLPIGNIVFRVQVASLDSHFMPSSGSSDKKIARFSNIRSSEKVTKAPNFNNRGNMDNVSGGYFDVQGQIQSSVEGGPPPFNTVNHIPLLPSAQGFLYSQLHLFGANASGEYRFSDGNNPINSFIPTFSAMAHLNPDQDWSNPLSFNLTCESNTLTPFDSYYGESLNTEHVSFNQKSIDWLLGNFALDVGDVLEPVFPIDTASFSSPDTMCVGDIVTIGFEDECKVASAPTYIVHSDNLRIVSQNGYSAQVEALSNGVGYIQVNISNSVGPSQGFGRQIHVGTPNLDNAFVTEIDSSTFLSLYPPNNFCDLVALRIDGIERFDLVDEIEMQKLPTSIAYWDGDQRTGRDNTVGIYPNCNELFRFQVRARNACGWSEWVEFVKDIDGCGNDCSSTSSSNIVSNNFIISPVPASTIIAIDMIQDPQWTFYTKACSDGIADVGGTTHCTYFVSIQLYDFSGNQVLNISHHELGTSFDISHLTTGTYVMHVSHGGQTEIHQIPIN